MNLSFQIYYWREIPAQVRVRSGRERFNRSLSPRFQEAIDEAAMRARATSTDAYLEDWRTTEWQQGEGEPGQFADQLAAELEAAYPTERLRTLMQNGGYE